LLSFSREIKNSDVFVFAGAFEYLRMLASGMVTTARPSAHRLALEAHGYGASF
jgi:hypothetical protein